ncbi:MAG TPA: hypothetical protein VIH57_18370 [Bacteroidales bacterium]
MKAIYAGVVQQYRARSSGRRFVAQQYRARSFGQGFVVQHGAV